MNIIPCADEGLVDLLVNKIGKMQGRTFDPDEIDMWEKYLQGIDLRLAHQAVDNLIMQSGGFITVHAIREEVGRIVAKRVTGVERMPEAPSQLSAAEYVEWKKTAVQALALGEDLESAEKVALQSVGRAAPQLTASIPGGVVEAMSGRLRDVSAVVEGEVIEGTIL